ncbi:phenylalanine--tRNA ligase beta subunit-related protein [Spongiactinospora sp. TRM90649]|uniref:B3/B4 domain-containing protein n=1 Tax=Spongiactinospora sp. TRM90649 TaxID=3031114 RepID=UPI0023F8DC76|nr:phenylalanine--tRNA ligase beta subunit-related protein [Spongiactinospora sp. TRM90649]MDF5752273.1 phenylalanine--tRNA ligase beta subunit-related protein [Spongiactinospora sp. TRM90649]
MYFQHDPAIWSGHPELVAGVVHVTGIHPDVSVGGRVDAFHTIAADRLVSGPESGFPEIQAWRRTFARMGLRPTQYRCAAESLLRRFKKEGTLPRIHPLIDLCNAVSLAFAIPIAVLDLAEVEGGLDVRHARGDEDYLTFSGEKEHPAVGEVIFVDHAGRAHARRWTNRQSGLSAVRDATRSVLIVAEAVHASARADVSELLAVLTAELAEVWHAEPLTALLDAGAPRFPFPAP